jgi:flagellum-specific ATP synthase
MLPQLLERTGTGERGAITALYTVLVDGDDLNEPIADAVRGILDGHIVLSRALATANHFPAIDVLESVSRLSRDVCNEDELSRAGRARDLLALYRKHEDVITIGAYARGSNARVDLAIEKRPAIHEFLRQRVDEKSPRAASYTELGRLLA